jgi:hypothetical protein
MTRMAIIICKYWYSTNIRKIALELEKRKEKLSLFAHDMTIYLKIPQESTIIVYESSWINLQKSTP